MADDFKRKFESLACKLTMDPKKDADLKKMFGEVSKAYQKEADDFDKTLKSLMTTLARKKKDAKDKEAKKTIEQLEALAKEDLEKRYTFKDASSSPS